VKALTKIDVMPLVFALHCYGCTSAQMIHWTRVAEEFSFVLAVPDGVESSWNSRYCCGYALQKKLDDVGFLAKITSDLDEELSFVSRDVAYAIGWSNGGYFSTYAAHLFRAVAPISGHQYDVDSLVSKPTALFMHHR
jgi:poly(3-hydroxybutyrate) depolymerase